MADNGNAREVLIEMHPFSKSLVDAALPSSSSPHEEPPHSSLSPDASSSSSISPLDQSDQSLSMEPINRRHSSNNSESKVSPSEQISLAYEPIDNSGSEGSSHSSHLSTPALALADSDSDDEDFSSSASSNIAVSLYNIHKTYLLGVEGVPALRGVTADIFKGEYVVVYGTSGGGKTSLLNIIGTIDMPTKGHLTVGGIRVSEKTPDVELAKLRNEKLGFVFQTFNLISTLTAQENVEMPMILQGLKSKADREKHAIRLLERVGMGHRLDHLPSQLSGGEQQRVTIARAMSNNPEILLLDEPTGDLDTKNTMIVMDMLLRVNEEDKITLVMVTHDNALKEYAQRAIFMRDGKIQRIETIDPLVRAKKIAELRAKVSGIQLGEHSAMRNGSGSSSSVGHAAKLTQVRRPRDYATYAENAEKMTEKLKALALSNSSSMRGITPPIQSYPISSGSSSNSQTPGVLNAAQVRVDLARQASATVIDVPN